MILYSIYKSSYCLFVYLFVCLLSRFGHASVLLEDGSFLVHGGFGMTGPRLSQSRLKSLINIEMNSEMEWKVKELQTTGDNPGQ